MSSVQKFIYSIAHRDFYEPLDTYAADVSTYYRYVRERLPASWQIVRNNVWFHCIPEDPTLPVQGWKIHLSTGIHTVEALLDAALPVLVADGVAFKFAADQMFYFLLVSKQWHRGGAGKFMTIYPRNQAHFEALIARLHAATSGHEGPFVLSDRRYKDSKCVFYRYGGIAPRTSLTVRGDRTPYIHTPSGEEIPDLRGAQFQLPSWLKDPFREEQALDPNAKRTLRNGRYEIQAALRFSNSGGLYTAIDTQRNQKVVIKEARPMVYVDPSGSESRNLLAKEYRLLQELESTGVAPRPVEFFEEWEHRFLVEEFIDGMTLRQHSVLHNVTKTASPTAADIEAFYQEFCSVFVQLAEVLETLGRHRIVFRDLSPTNVLISASGAVRLVDFEAACQIGVDPLAILFTPGFASADHVSSDLPQLENDYFGLGALMFAYFMPIHAALGLDTTIHERFIDSIGEETGLPVSLLQLIKSLMSREPAERPCPSAVIHTLANPSPMRGQRPIGDLPTDDEISSVISRTIQYTTANISTGRIDRLFPCDPKAFATNPCGLAYGAAGIAYALKRLTGECPRAAVDWILNQPISTDTYCPGLFAGMAGVAWVLLELGLEAEARRILASSAQHPLLRSSSDIFYGIAGWGLTQLKFYTSLGNDAFAQTAIECGEHLIDSRIESERGWSWGDPSQPIFGYAHGSAGISTFLIYLYAATGEVRFFTAARNALSYDLAQAVELDGALLWPSRTGAQRAVVPYWRYGSAGIGTALLRHYQITGDPEQAALLQGIKRAVTRKHAIFPARGFGLAGLGDFLLDLASNGIDEADSLQAARHVAAGVMLFALDKGSAGIAFPGADLWKISCDYSTGGAGIALFLNRLVNGAPADFMLDDLLAGYRRTVAPATQYAVAAAVPVAG